MKYYIVKMNHKSIFILILVLLPIYNIFSDKKSIKQDNKITYNISIFAGPVLSSNIQETNITGYGSFLFLVRHQNISNIPQIRWLKPYYGFSTSIINIQSKNDFINLTFLEIGPAISFIVVNTKSKNESFYYFNPFLTISSGLNYASFVANNNIGTLRDGILGYFSLSMGAIIQPPIPIVSFIVSYKININIHNKGYILNNIIALGILAHF